jgi:CRP/FNR family cyclic AMP-dependent transcriptional regulator
MPPKPSAVGATPPAFNVEAFLKSAGVSPRTVRFATGAVVYVQGAQANSVFYVQEGGVKLSVLSSAGKLGLIEYNGGLKVNSSLLSIVLQSGRATG